MAQNNKYNVDSKADRPDEGEVQMKETDESRFIELFLSEKEEKAKANKDVQK